MKKQVIINGVVHYVLSKIYNKSGELIGHPLGTAILSNDKRLGFIYYPIMGVWLMYRASEICIN